jgi:type IV secretory pathway TraG/TraD family ATPase VirD4
LRRNVGESKDVQDVFASWISVAVLLVPVFYALGFMFWLSAQLSGLLVGNGWPASTAAQVPSILFRLIKNPRDPAAAWPEGAQADLGPLWLTLVLTVLLTVPLVALAVFIVRWALDVRRRRVWRHFRLGFASRSEVDRLLSAKSVLAKAGHVRPTFKNQANVQPTDVGFYIGRDVRSSQKLYASVEDGMVIVGGPRQGKDAHFCTSYVLDAPGAVIVTSTRADVFTATVEARSKVGKIYVFDPQQWTKWPEVLRWSPVLGCDDPNDAKKRADYLIATTGVELDGLYARTVLEAQATLRHMLHAAAIADKTIRDVARWATDPTDPEPLDILRRYEAAGVAAPGCADALEKTIKSGEEHRDGVYYLISRAMGMFVDPRVMNAFSAPAAEAFDLNEFVSGRNTLYLLDREAADSHLGHLVALILGDSLGRARVQAIRSPEGRLDPPLTVEINDAVNVAPLMGLPSMMVDLTGFSIALHVYLQDLSSARLVWGDAGANTLWSNATVRVVLGGGGNPADLTELSRLIGKTDDRDGTVVRDIMSAEEIRTLEFGTAVVVARAARPVEVSLTPWWKRPDAGEIEEGRRRTEARIAQHMADAAADIQARMRMA